MFQQQDPPDGLVELVRQAAMDFVVDIVEALPKILAGIVFLILAIVVVRVVMAVVRAALGQLFADESPVYRQFLATIVAAFLWFGVALSFLSVVGLEQIAAAIGTASGFLALGVSYALSEMIKDAVAGVYLLRDPDFNPGDRITAGDMTGTVDSIELRKTRVDVGDDRIVRANAEIEKRWTRHEHPESVQEHAPEVATGSETDATDTTETAGSGESDGEESTAAENGDAASSDAEATGREGEGTGASDRGRSDE